MIFFALTDGSSSSHSTPASDSADFDIFAVGFCRSKMRAVSCWITGIGTRKVWP